MVEIELSGRNQMRNVEFRVKVRTTNTNFEVFFLSMILKPWDWLRPTGR